MSMSSSGGCDSRDVVVAERMDYSNPASTSEAKSNTSQEMEGVSQREQDLTDQIISLAHSNFTVDATVVAEDTRKQGSERLVYKSAKLKPRKQKDVIEQERQEERKQIEAAKALEEEEYRQEIAKRNVEETRLKSDETLRTDAQDNVVK
ncbi:hypothetical protein CGCSCA5_v001688 [Colletotrichum siamense]|nr:hypothetical protein CGCSCA5_v001688 [Colletotrichum siamense]